MTEPLSNGNPQAVKWVTGRVAKFPTRQIRGPLAKVISPTSCVHLALHPRSTRQSHLANQRGLLAKTGRLCVCVCVCVWFSTDKYKNI